MNEKLMQKWTFTTNQNENIQYLYCALPLLPYFNKYSIIHDHEPSPNSFVFTQRVGFVWRLNYGLRHKCGGLLWSPALYLQWSSAAAGKVCSSDSLQQRHQARRGFVLTWELPLQFVLIVPLQHCSTAALSCDAICGHLHGSGRHSAVNCAL